MSTSLVNTIKAQLEKRKASLIKEAEDKIKDDDELEKDDEKGDKKDDVEEKKKKKLKEEDDKDDKDDEDDDKKDDKDDDEKEEIKNEKKKKLKESLSKIFAKIELDEAVSEELQTLFLASLSEAVDAHKRQLEEETEKNISDFITESEGNIDTYLTFVAKQWLTENEVAVESGIKVEIAENFFGGMKQIFTENYVEVPESKVDLIDEAEATIEQLIEKVDQSQEQVIKLQEELNQLKTKKIVDEIAGDLTETQKEKLGTLIDNIEYESDEDYKKRVSIVLENYFGKNDDSADDKKEDINEDKKEVKNPRMDLYKAALQKK